MVDKVTITSPDAQFRAVMGEFQKRAGRTMMDTINSRLLDIAIKVWGYTKLADKAAIQAKLGAIFQFGSFSKRGKFRRWKRAKTTVDEGHSLAYSIVQSRHFKTTGKWLPVAEAKQKAVRLIGAVVRSVGFIRVGFLPALKRLNSVVRAARERLTGIAEPRGINESGQKGRPKGYVYPARNVAAIRAEFGNTTKAAAPIAGPALERAIAESKSWMVAKVKADMEKGAVKPLTGKEIG